MLRPVLKTLCLSVLACLAGPFAASDAQAQVGGYIYTPNSYYQSPPVYFYDGYYIPPGARLLPAAPAPITPVAGYYAPLAVNAAPVPVTGYYEPLPINAAPVTIAPVASAPVYVAPMAVAPVYGRVRETWGGNHYRYHVGYSGGGPGYTYRARSAGNRVIVHERFR